MGDRPTSNAKKTAVQGGIVLLNILVINVARIGDTLLVTPILRAIKQAYPQHRLGCLAHPRRMLLLRGLPFIDALGSPHKAMQVETFNNLTELGRSKVISMSMQFAYGAG